MRVALGIEYNGAAYSGWQRQRDEGVIGVQQRVEEALSKIGDQAISITCAGRTDAGVHATAQVVHFDCSSSRDMRAWTLGVNSNLPNDISVKWAQPVAEDFDARYSATARRYRYLIYNQAFRPAVLQTGITHYYADKLDAKVMHDAAQQFVGRHDFSSFRAMHCQANTPVRDLTHINITRYGDYIVVDVQANAFLHHMVRNIVGTLIEIGRGLKVQEWVSELLLAKDRSIAAPTAKPHGLYLVKVIYPEQWKLPITPMGPLFLADN